MFNNMKIDNFKMRIMLKIKGHLLFSHSHGLTPSLITKRKENTV